jgi:integrase
MMATFGIRPHEVFQCDREEFLRKPEDLCILADSKTGRKTGGRRTRAIYPEWVETFRLTDIPTNFSSRGADNTAKGQNVSRWFRDAGVPFEPYNLRHAWAIRCLMLDIPDVIAARMMGHSIAHHQQIYLHWIQQRGIDRVVDEALARR